jgi:ABC-2 type transport system permease protein
MAATTPRLAGERRWSWALRDGVTILRRDLTYLRYSPSELAAQAIVPIVMIMIFGYVFGGAIDVPGDGSYREFLMPGLFAMMQVTAVAATATTVADDLARGVTDRLRAMPIAPSAVPFGQTAANLATGALNLAIMALCGLAVGWRAHHGLLDAVAAFALLLLVRYALGWAGIYLGLLIRNPRTADQLVPLVFPLTMIANTFVPTTGMPGWLQTIADYNPVSCLVAATRDLFANPGAGHHATTWPLQHPILATLAWSILILAIAAPLASRRYRTLG